MVSNHSTGGPYRLQGQLRDRRAVLPFGIKTIDEPALAVFGGPSGYSKCCHLPPIDRAARLLKSRTTLYSEALATKFDEGALADCRNDCQDFEGARPWDFPAAARVAQFVTASAPNRFAPFNVNAGIARWIPAAGISSVFVFPRSALQITGEVREIARTSDRGATKRKGFCPNCGVSIYNKPDKVPDMIGIYVGSLDNATAFKPAVVLYAARGYAWDFLDPDVPKLPEWHSGS